MEIHPTNKNEVAWTSWMPALGYALAASTGPVLEIGIGHFSTPFLHEYCKGAGRKLYSLESSPEWMEGFLRYDCHNNENESPHFVWQYDNPCALNGLRDSAEWGVVFIDNSPGGEARAKPFRDFMHKSQFIVVHDYHRENEEAIKPFLEGVNYKVFNDYEPPTLLASVKHKL